MDRPVANSLRYGSTRRIVMAMAELKDTLEEKRKLVNQKATQYRNTCDENSRTKEHTVIRNELNAEVRELIQMSASNEKLVNK